MKLRLIIQRSLRVVVAVAAVTFLFDATVFAQETMPHRVAAIKIIPLCGNQPVVTCKLEVMSFREKGSGTDQANRFWLGSGTGIPYGTYEAKLYFADAWPVVPIIRTVEISQPSFKWVIDLRPQPRVTAPNSAGRGI